MQSNWLILILFALSWNFPNIITFGSSGVPFAFIFPSILVIPNLFKDIFIDKKDFHIKVCVLLFIVFFTVLLSFYSLQLDFREYFIRLFQISSGFIVYFYVRNKFFLNVSYSNAIKVIIILQIPSIMFGFLEVVYSISNYQFLENLLINIRTVTAHARADVVRMKTIVLHFFEHSMAAYYFVAIGLIIFINYSSDKKIFYKNYKLYNYTILTFIFIFLFHKSTTLVLLLVFFALIFLIKTRSILFGLSLLLFLTLTLSFSVHILHKISIVLNGGIIASDMFRLTSAIAGLWNYFNNPIMGTGPGTWSVYFYDGLYNLFETFNFSQQFEDLVLLNSYVNATNIGRAPLNSAYLALLSEYGLIFIFYIILFHGPAFRINTNFHIAELTVIAGLFLGYPLGYPYFWFVLGLVHSNLSDNQLPSRINFMYTKSKP